jgi:hypothetical protein
VKPRDAEFIISIAVPDITTGFGEERGIEAFRRQQRLDDPSSEFWTVIADLIAKGSTVGDTCTENSHCSVGFPYWSERFPHPRLGRIWCDQA